MSFAALKWACEQRLPAMQKMVLVALANRHNGETGRCDPSIETLAEDCGMVSRSVMRSLEALVAAKLVSRTLRTAAGMKTSNAYSLAFTDVTESHNVVTESHNDVTHSHSGSDSQSLSVVTQSHINQESLTRKKEPFSRAERKGKDVDPRHSPFRKEFERAYLLKNGVQAPWNGREAKQLSEFLASTPLITEEQWERVVRNRFASADANGSRLSTWVMDAGKWYKAPLDQFNRPMQIAQVKAAAMNPHQERMARMKQEMGIADA